MKFKFDCSLMVHLNPTVIGKAKEQSFIVHTINYIMTEMFHPQLNVAPQFVLSNFRQDHTYCSNNAISLLYIWIINISGFLTSYFLRINLTILFMSNFVRCESQEFLGCQFYVSFKYTLMRTSCRGIVNRKAFHIRVPYVTKWMLSYRNSYANSKVNIHTPEVKLDLFLLCEDNWILAKLSPLIITYKYVKWW